MGRPAKKKNYFESKAREKGILDAHTEHTAHIFRDKKKMQNYVFDKINSIIDRIEPLEAAAILGATYLIKTVVLDTSEQIVTKIKVASEKPVPFGFGYIAGQYIGMIPFLGPIFTGMVDLATHVATGTTVEQEIRKTDVLPDVISWLLAFILAYVLVKHGGALLGFMQDAAIPMSSLAVSLIA